jgi:16S rRNA (uracil1498-N3)-methyltransferase
MGMQHEYRMRRFFVPASQIHASQVILRGAEFHHLRHVLRLAVGDRIILRDDLGNEHEGTITMVGASEAEVRLTVSRPAVQSSFSLTLVQGLLKGQKMDLLMEKATELGVSAIIPFSSTFTVAQVPSERSHERLARWQRIAQSAAKQSGSVVPQIFPVQSFAEIIMATHVPDEKVLLYEREREHSLKAFAQSRSALSSLLVIVGPEGGFAEEEVTQAREAGFHIVRLGSQVLRAETAGIVAVALCQFLWSNGGIPLGSVQV